MQKIGRIIKRHSAWMIPLAILTVGLVAAGAVWWTQRPSAASALVACKGTEGITCYKEYLTKKVADKDAVSAVDDLRAVYDSDPYVVGQCHELTHIIGHAAYKKYGTIADAYTKGDSFCWSGYYHGVTEEAIGQMGADRIRQEANGICAGLAKVQRYSFDHYNCVHGLGHGFMAVESFDLFKALTTCDALEGDWEKESCYGGAFMENVMVAVRGDGSSQYLKPDQPFYPCTDVGTPYKHSCYQMQTSYVLKLNGYNFADAFAGCKNLRDVEFINSCYESIGRDAAGSSNSEVAPSKNNCSAAPDTAALQQCVYGAARNFVSYFHSDVQAREFCASYQASAPQVATSCYDEVATYYGNF